MTDDRIIANISTRAFTTATRTSGPLTADGLRESLREFARQFDPDRRIAGRLEVGELVRQHLTAIAEPAPRPPAWLPQPAMLGVPVVHNDNLQPDEWRLLDTDGEVMGEGRLEWRQL
ncbi:hypothetical protein MED01_002373 [Micromonospora sp. MED01]|uniref:hypothetical protein n=1 Tax=Micromonospora alfalfae TaxID=2911212 RepID=UPI001EE7E347|nr:hypothetical protein [Micromonospora alfalfae]MCG5464208.1 hypothetical protein [Micromonospora alfalfae]